MTVFGIREKGAPIAGTTQISFVDFPAFLKWVRGLGEVTLMVDGSRPDGLITIITEK